jgi:IS5 family transposase
MLTSDCLVPLTDAERQLYLEVVPEDHLLRRVLQCIDFEAFRPLLETAYTGFGRPPLDCVFMLKLELLARQYRLSDREVIAAARFNVAQRLFLGISLRSPLPHHTLLTYFRQRLGPERLQPLFDSLVGQARRLGLVRDRLRLKDATHILANIAVPSTIRLVAEVRNQLLDALRPFAAGQVAEEEERAESIRQGTEDAQDQERLVERVTHLRAVLVWADDLTGQAAFAQGSVKSQEQLRAALALAHKVLADREAGATDKVLSAHDPDARRGKHGDFYEGYLVDVAMDADSEIITAVNVLPANGDEGADASHLITQEEQAQGNDVAAVSMDGAGFRGSVLRELTNPAGLHLEVFTPPSEQPVQGFPPERFTLTVIGNQPALTCPAGATTTTRYRNDDDTATIYRFRAAQCLGCSLRSTCLANPGAKIRSVTKNDYETEYTAAKVKAQTPEYAAVRRQHPAIERKLAELVRRHDLRHARYRGRLRVLYQSLLTSMVVNLKRMVRLLWPPSEESQGMVRAEWAASG